MGIEEPVRQLEFDFMPEIRKEAKKRETERKKREEIEKDVSNDSNVPSLEEVDSIIEGKNLEKCSTSSYP